MNKYIRFIAIMLCLCLCLCLLGNCCSLHAFKVEKNKEYFEKAFVASEWLERFVINNIEQINKDKFCEILSNKECVLKWQDERFIISKYKTIDQCRSSKITSENVENYIYQEIPELKKYENYLIDHTGGETLLTVYLAGESNEVDSEGIVHPCYMIYVGESHPDHDVNWEWFFVDKNTSQIFWMNIYEWVLYTLDDWRQSTYYRKIEEW